MREFGWSRRSECGAFIVDRRGTILGFDEAMEQLTGWPAIDVVGHNKTLGLVADDDAEQPINRFPLYDGEIPEVSRSRAVELALHHRDGRRLEVDAVADRLAGPGERIRLTVLRVLARSPINGNPSVEERVDKLTGLPTPDAFAHRLSAAFVSASATAQPMALILADVDHLRRINDRIGHDAGDEVLRRLAGILRVSVEDETRLCRLGDDDFAILLPRSGRGEARQFAAGLRSTVERYRFFHPTGHAAESDVTLSLGAASFPADAETEADLMDRAQEALNEARAMGRNRVWCYLRRPRVPVSVPVFFDAAESLLVGYTRDLSPSGLFVQTSVPIDIGMRCALAFPLPGYAAKVHVIGRVVRTVATEFADDCLDLAPPGMGVEFERFSGTDDRHAIESFLHDHESTTLRPESGSLSS